MEGTSAPSVGLRESDIAWSITFQTSVRLLLAGAIAWMASCGLTIAGFALLFVPDGGSRTASTPALERVTLVGLLNTAFLGSASLLLAVASRSTGRAAKVLQGFFRGTDDGRALENLEGHGRRAGASFAALGGFTFLSAVGLAAIAAGLPPEDAVRAVAFLTILAIISSLFLLHAALHLTIGLRSLRRRLLPGSEGRPLINLQTYAIPELLGSIVVAGPLLLAASGHYPALGRDVCFLVGGTLLSAVVAPLVGLLAFADIVRFGLSVQRLPVGGGPAAAGPR